MHRFKSLKFILLILLIVSACTSKNEMLLKGRLKGANEGKLIVRQKIDGLFIETDTLLLSKRGRFKYKKVLTSPDVYYLNYFDTKMRGDDVVLFLDNERIKLKGYYDSLTICSIKGLDDQLLWDSINAKTLHYEADIDAIFGMKMMAKSDAEKVKLDGRMHSAHSSMIKSQQHFVEENLDKAVGAHVLTKVQFDYTLDELENLILSFDSTIQNNATCGYLYQRVQKRRKMLPGNICPEFTAATLDGDTISILELASKHEYTLIDFWASWCFPYTNEVPEILSMYDKYHDKGFEIVGISIDIYQPSMIDTRKMYKLNWPQIYDGNGWHGLLARLYGLNTLPYNYLIDKNGEIITANVRGVELEAKLEELFSKPVI